MAIAVILLVVTAACGQDATSPTDTTVAAPATIGFNDAGGHGETLVIYRESGYLVMPYAGPWTFNRNYGHPSPFIWFVRTASEDTTVGEIRVSAGGARFRFRSVDLYSSITTIPFAIAGFFGGSTVFTIAGTVPNTFGNFATVVNPSPGDVITGLAIV
jgi:hypothetical protein